MAVICKQCYWCAEKVGVLNFWGNVVLFIIKGIGGIFGRSQALMADALHSVSDIVISVLVMVGLKITGAPPDEDHGWGHGHIEFIVSAIIGVLLLFCSVTITVTSLVSILEGELAQPGILAVWAAIISIATNEIMYRHSLCIGKQMDSPAMIANAWENRADVYSSTAALIGVFGARLGFTFLDPVGAIVVGFMIAKSGVSTLSTAVQGITDGGVDKGKIERVRGITTSVKGIKGIGNLRARKIGQKDWVDMEVEFAPDTKVAEAREIAGRVSRKITDNIEEVGGIHIIPRVKAAER